MPHIELPEPHPSWLRYLVAVGASALAIMITVVLIASGLRLHSGFMLTAVVIAAWFGGFGPGVLSLLLGVPGQILLRHPIGVWRIDGIVGWSGFLVYIFNSLVICLLFRKRYIRRIRTEVSPAVVTGGWMWKYDPTDGGTVEIHSPEFPHLSVTRTFTMWLETVHPDDKMRVEQSVRDSLRSGKLDLTFHAMRDDGEIRRISMAGVKVENEPHLKSYLLATCIEVGAQTDAEKIEWHALPLG